MSAPVAVAAALAGVGAYAFYLRRTAASQESGPGDGSAKPSAGKPVFSGFGFHSLRLHSTELVNHNTKRLRFELPDPSKPSGLSLCSALLTISWPTGRWVPVLRPYTPVNALDEPGYIEFLVKHYPGGKQSTHIHSLKPGDTLTFAPIPSFPWKANLHPHVGLIAGGAGITPMYQLARGILDNPKDEARVTLVWGVNTDEDIFLKDEFAALEKKFPDRFKAVYVVSQPVSGSPYQKGYVTKEVLQKAGLDPRDEENDGAKVLVCGPPAMEKALKGGKGPFGGQGILQQLGWEKRQIYGF